MKKILALWVLLLLTIVSYSQKKPLLVSKKVGTIEPVTKKDVSGGKSAGTLRPEKMTKEQLKPASGIKANKALQKYMASLPQKTFTLPGGRKSRVSLINTNSPYAMSRANVGQRIKSKGKDKNCETIEISVSAESEDFDVPYENSSAYIYPGAVYLYSDYYSNNVNPRRLVWARNPVFVQASSASTSGKYILVNDPTSNELHAAAGSIKSSLPPPPTNLNSNITVTSVFDEADFRFKVNAGAGGMGFSAKASFGVSNNASKRFFMIDAKQVLFTLMANLPEVEGATVFKDDVNNQNKEALFMSTVNYGRRVIGVIETEFESSQTEASFKAEYSAGFAGGYGSLDLLNKMSSGKTKVKLYYVGGDGNAVSVPNPTEQSVTDVINRWLKTGTNQNAVPVSFSFRNMAMDPMRYESSTDKFTYQQCTPILPDLMYRVSVNLQTVTNELHQMETVKFGLLQYANFYTASGKLLNEKQINNKVNLPLVAWGVPTTVYITNNDKTIFPGPPASGSEEAKMWKGQKSIGRQQGITISQAEINAGAYVELKTKYIAMYATRIAGGDDTERLNKVERIKLKDIMNGAVSNKTIDISFNGRSFALLFSLTATPVK